jgi:xylulokinase
MRLAVPFGDCQGDAEILNNYMFLLNKRLEIEQELVKRFGRHTYAK